MKPSGTLSRTNSAAISPKRSGPLRPTPLDRQGATLDPTEFVQSLNKGGSPCTPGRRRARSKEPNDRHLRWLLRARRERPRSRTAEQRDERAASHCPVPPVLERKDSTPPNGRRLLHPSTVAVRDDRRHAAGIFSKEVAQKQATLLPRQDLPHCQKSFQTKFPGMAPG